MPRMHRKWVAGAVPGQRPLGLPALLMDRTMRLIGSRGFPAELLDVAEPPLPDLAE